MSSTGDGGVVIPPYLPPALAVVCACAAGLTSFGDAILFHILWAIAGAIGLIPAGRRETLTKAVLYLTVMPLANQPLFLWVSRTHILRCVPYGVVMAATGLAMVPVGTSLLFSGDLQGLKIGVGLFFTIFSVIRLTQSVRGLGFAAKSVREDARGRTHGVDRDALGAGAGAGDKDAGARADAQSMGGDVSVNGSPESGAVAGQKALEEGTLEEVIVSPRGGAAAMPVPASLGADSAHKTNGTSGATAASAASMAPADESPATKPTCFQRMWRSRYVPRPSPGPHEPMRVWKFTITPISPSYSVMHTLTILFLTGTASGLLGGLFGTGGPPQMIAFAVLSLDKDIIRGVSVVYGLLDICVRVALYTTASESVFDPSEWYVYLAIAGASWVGFASGTWLRRFADTDAIIRMLLALVFASSSILLGALDNVAVAAVFAIGGCIWAVILVAMYRRPAWWERVERDISQARQTLPCCKKQEAQQKRDDGKKVLTAHYGNVVDDTALSPDSSNEAEIVGVNATQA